MTDTNLALFARQLYHNLGDRWASALLAFLLLAMTPLPFIFYTCNTVCYNFVDKLTSADGAAMRKKSTITKRIYPT